VPFIDEDTILYRYMEAVRQLVRQGSVVRAVGMPRS